MDGHSTALADLDGPPALSACWLLASGAELSTEESTAQSSAKLEVSGITTKYDSMFPNSQSSQILRSLGPGTHFAR